MSVAAILGGFGGWYAALLFAEAPDPSGSNAVAHVGAPQSVAHAPSTNADQDQPDGPSRSALTIAGRRSTHRPDQATVRTVALPDGRTAVAGAASPSNSAREANTEHERGSVVHRPVRIIVPAIDVSAPLVELGLAKDGGLETPSEFDAAGWWHGGAAPGEQGPAVIVGHVDSYVGPAVFHDLQRLAPHDLIEIHGEDGTIARFQVDRVEQHSKNAFPTDDVYGGTPEPALRLITCAGPFDRTHGHYEDNLVVYARAVPDRE